MISMSMKDCEVYLRGLKRFKDKGVGIIIDGEHSDESGWNKILARSDDSSYYMGDYIEDDQGILREIHFNKMIY